MSDQPKRRRPSFSFDTEAPKAPPLPPEPADKSKVQASKAYDAYMKQMKPTWDRIDAERAKKGLPPAPRPTLRQFELGSPLGDEKPELRGESPEPDIAPEPELPPPNTFIEVKPINKKRSFTPFKGREPPPGQRAQPVIHTHLDETDPATTLNPHLPKISNFTVASLPSKGLSYPAGATIKYRTYMLGEIEELEESNLSDKDKYLLLLKGIETNFSKRDITLSDLLYLGLLRRISTLGAEKINVDTFCPRCGGKNTHVVATANITGHKGATVAFDDLKCPALPVKLNLTFGEHAFNPITIGDWLALLDSGVEVNTVSMIAIQCHSVDWPESVALFEQAADPKDVRLLRRLDDLFYHSLAPIRVNCSNRIPSAQEGGPMEQCTQNYPVELESVADAFIYPFREDGDNDDDEISFGE